MGSTQLASTVDFCRSIPKEPTRLIPIDHILEEIHRNIAERADIVLLNGEPLTGKTEALSQYFRKYPDNCIGLFLGVGSSLFRSADYLRLLIAEQISWIVHKKALTEDTVDEDSYKRLLWRLQKQARNTKITWLIDGLAQESSAETGDTKELWDLIPIATAEFNFVITGQHTYLNRIKLHGRSSRPMDTAIVSTEEAKTFLADLNLTLKDVQEVRTFARGSIGRIQKIRSLLLEGISIEDLFEKNQGSLDALFELEWGLVPNNDQTHLLLALVVFSARALSKKEVSNLMHVPEEAINELAAACKILSFTDNALLVIESRAQRAFISKRLVQLENKVRDMLIAELLNKPYTRESTQDLPLQLSKAGRNSELIQHLNTDHFVRLLESERTLRSLRRHAQIGYEAAKKTNDEANEAAFSLISSTVTGLTFSLGTVEQIHALIKLGQTELALEIATVAPTAEEKLKLIASAAKGLSDQNEEIPQDLRNEISILTKDIDGESLGDMGVDIACDLLATDFKLATDLIDQVMAGSRKRIDTSRENSDNPGLQKKDLDKSEILKKRTLSKVPDHKFDRFWSLAGKRIEKLKAESLLQKAQKEDPAFGLTIAKRWLQGNRKNKDAYKIANSALDLLLSNTARSPQIQDLREIASILPHLEDESLRAELSSRINTQYRILEHHGTTAESIRLRMFLYSAEPPISNYEIDTKLVDLSIEISTIDDLSTRVTCWAWMLHHLSLFSHSEERELRTGLMTEASESLETAINELLTCSADHFSASKQAVAAIARTDPARAFDIVTRLNNLGARDTGFEALARNLIYKHSDTYEIILKCVRAIEDDHLRDSMVVELVMTINLMKKSKDFKKPSPDILSLWKSIGIAPYKIQAATIAFVFATESGCIQLAQEIKSSISAIWLDMPTDIVKVKLGYLIAREVASIDRDLATEWINKSQQLCEKSRIASDSVSSALYSTVSLGARLLASILPIAANVEEQSNFRRIDNLVACIPSCELQVALWANFAVRLHYHGNENARNFIAENRIIPLIDRDYTDNEHLKGPMTAIAIPALYLTHQSSAMHRIDSLVNSETRDLCRSNIISTILQKIPNGEPYNVSGRDLEYQLDAKSLSDVVAVSKHLTTDSLIYKVVSDVSRSLVSDYCRTKIPRTLALDYLKTLEAIADKRLPDQKNIKHKGFLIVTKAAILKARSIIQKDTPTQVYSSWEKLYEDARLIKNVSDRAIVTAIVGVNSKIKITCAVSAWLLDTKSDLSQIPFAHDRIGRYEWAAKIIEPFDKLASRNLISEALNLTKLLPRTDDIMERQRTILDFAHNLDPALANELVQQFDQDEARRLPLERRIEENTKRKALATKPNTEEMSELDDTQLADLCYENLGALNIGRIHVRPLNEFQELMSRAGSMSIQGSYPVWGWLVENAIRKRGTAGPSPDGACQKLFEAACKASEITYGLIGKISRPLTVEITSATVIKGGDRGLFFSRVTDWAKHQDGKVVYISDPYFSPRDLELVKRMAEAAPNAKFRILASKENINFKLKISMPDDAFLEAWQDIADIDPPYLEVVVIGFGPSGKHPIHDRWITTDASGLNLGSSINSIGVARISDVCPMPESEAFAKFSEIEKFFLNPPRTFCEERLSHFCFRI
ncbi:MAG: hypothetical protein EOP10_08490 [Proteobacteria bacterium]|nr:MAG: hypothetical protein EOP10_08490 [Pseudomonadota bacterium]